MNISLNRTATLGINFFYGHDPVKDKPVAVDSAIQKRRAVLNVVYVKVDLGSGLESISLKGNMLDQRGFETAQGWKTHVPDLGRIEEPHRSLIRAAIDKSVADARADLGMATA